MKFVVSLTIVNDNPSLTIVIILINENKFKNDSFLKQSYKKRSLIVFIKTIVIHFLKVQKRVDRLILKTIVFENDRKTKQKLLNPKYSTVQCAHCQLLCFMCIGLFKIIN